VDEKSDVDVASGRIGVGAHLVGIPDQLLGGFGIAVAAARDVCMRRVENLGQRGAHIGRVVVLGRGWVLSRDASHLVDCLS
jgi:hypothetical protein